MRKYINISLLRLAFTFVLFFCILLFTSCEDLLQVSPPRSQVLGSKAYEDDVSATAATTGIYVQMRNMSSFSSGSNQSVSVLSGLSSDELMNFPEVDLDMLEFELNSLRATNGYVKSLWSSAYKAIYQANAVIEGLRDVTSATVSKRDQLLAEALFSRAYVYFYLVNLFGEVPLATSTDFRSNSMLKKSSVSDIYSQILTDLNEAKPMLKSAYPTQGRVRPNRAACSAVLARVYLYLSRWEDAIQESTEVIDDPQYSLTDLNSVFLGGSTEAIWQFDIVANDTYTTFEGMVFIIQEEWQINNVLSDDLISAFEANDNRRTAWVGEFVSSSGQYFFPYKYKWLYGNGDEKSTILRLAEQFLIRSEARANLGKLSEAISDLDVIRDRAGLPKIADVNPEISQSELISAILFERRIEFFSEWGHRWFDLKRTNRAESELGPLKSDWDSSDLAYPIPASEIINNPNL